MIVILISCNCDDLPVHNNTLAVGLVGATVNPIIKPTPTPISVKNTSKFRRNTKPQRVRHLLNILAPWYIGVILSSAFMVNRQTLSAVSIMANENEYTFKGTHCNSVVDIFHFPFPEITLSEKKSVFVQNGLFY